MAYEFRFPDIGEGVTEGELLSWKVKEGDQVAEDQTLAEMETDKAVVEMPSPRAGRVAKLHAAAGDIVNVGDVLVTIEEQVGEEVASAAAPAPVRTVAGAGETAGGAETVAPTTAPLEAVIPRAGQASVPVAAVGAPVGTAEREPKPKAEPEPKPEPEPHTGSVVGRLEEAPEEEEAEEEAKVLALPSVRALARELGVDLRGLRGTGPGGRILKQDVEDMAQTMAYGAAGWAGGRAAPPLIPAREGPATEVEAAVAAVPAGGPEAEMLSAVPSGGPEAAIPTGVESQAPEATRVPEEAIVPLMGGVIESDGHGPVERVLFRGVRRSMARRMAEAVAKQAQVTTMDEADVTIIKRIREKERTLAAERGVRLTYLAFVVKACTASLKRFPRLNAVLEESGEEFVLKRYYNIGIAIDTRSGLIVPNIKDADRKSIFRIAEDIVDLVDRAEERNIGLQELRGGTFTITNYGAIGGLYATPVINYPEVAILGMGRVKEVPVAREGKAATRLMLPLALTFDHRLVDGAEAARFLNLVIGYLEDPDLLLLEGA